MMCLTAQLVPGEGNVVSFSNRCPRICWERGWRQQSLITAFAWLVPSPSLNWLLEWFWAGKYRFGGYWKLPDRAFLFAVI